MMRIIYASFIRFPAEKAHALYVAKSCEAFAELDCDVELIVPRRFGIYQGDYKTFFNLRHTFKLVRLPCIDLIWLPIGKSIAHKLGLLTFGDFVLLYVWWTQSDETLFVTNDVWLALLVTFTKVRVVYEIHDYPTGQWWLYRLVAKRAYKIQTNNQLKVDFVVRDLHVSRDKVYAVHNGVSIEDFDIPVSKDGARQRLSLDSGKKYAVYTGHLYDWKGADVLAEAAKYVPEIDILFVGGTKGEVANMSKRYYTYPNVHFLGHHEHKEIPYYLKAADVLVLPNSGTSALSQHHTSPMKLFEYMATKRPIVASDLPAVREILHENNAILVQSDNAEKLAVGIRMALEKNTNELTERAFENVIKNTWKLRGKKILKNLK